MFRTRCNEEFDQLVLRVQVGNSITTGDFPRSRQQKQSSPFFFQDHYARSDEPTLICVIYILPESCTKLLSPGHNLSSNLLAVATTKPGPVFLTVNKAVANVSSQLTVVVQLKGKVLSDRAARPDQLTSQMTNSSTFRSDTLDFNCAQFAVISSKMTTSTLRGRNDGMAR